MTDAIDRLLEMGETEGRDRPIAGLVFAVVDRITDEGYELRYLSLNHDEPSAPARYASPTASNGQGVFMGPHEGDEVVVGFEHGDINRPIILGSLWNDEATPPQQADQTASNNVITIVSPAQQELSLDSSPGANKIVLKAEGVEIELDSTSRKITIKTSGAVATSRIVLDGVAWNHQHATGTGPSGPPVSITPVT